MGYKGLEMTSQNDYLFSDTIPYEPEFNLEQLKLIENKLFNFTSGLSSDGLTTDEAEVFLDWVTFNARSYATRNIPESALTASMTGQCAPTQGINFKLLSKLGLDVKTFNTADCIGEVPMTNEDIRRIQNGFFSPAVRHAVSLVSLPLIDNNGNTYLYKFLLDPTFRQFCLKKDCNESRFVDANWLDKGHPAPYTGYFMNSDNLRQLGVDEEIAQKSELLGKQIISRGYFYLNDENAKLYGDAFVRASSRLEFQGLPIYTSGEEYISNFENNPAKLFIIMDNDVNKFTKLPSEIYVQKQNVFSKLINFFKNKFNNTPSLPEGSINHQNVANLQDISRERNNLAELTKEQYHQFVAGETQILTDYHNNANQNTKQNRNVTSSERNEI